MNLKHDPKEGTEQEPKEEGAEQGTKDNQENTGQGSADDEKDPE